MNLKPPSTPTKKKPTCSSANILNSTGIHPNAANYARMQQQQSSSGSLLAPSNANPNGHASTTTTATIEPQQQQPEELTLKLNSTNSKKPETAEVLQGNIYFVE